MPCPSQFFTFNHLTILGEWYKLRSSSLWSLLHSPFSSLLGPKYSLQDPKSIVIQIPRATRSKSAQYTGCNFYMDIAYTINTSSNVALRVTYNVQGKCLQNSFANSMQRSETIRSDFQYSRVG